MCLNIIFHAKKKVNAEDGTTPVLRILTVRSWRAEYGGLS